MTQKILYMFGRKANFSPTIFDVQLLESMDVEPTDMKGDCTQLIVGNWLP